MPTLRAYLRCSHIDSAASGLGLDAQRAAIAAYVAFQRSQGRLAGLDWASDGWIEGPLLDAQGAPQRGSDGKRLIVTERRQDGYYADLAVSAYRKRFRRRPAGGRLDAALRRGDVVIFAKLDRAFRSAGDFHATMETWAARGVDVHFIDPAARWGTPDGLLCLGAAVLFAEYDSALKGRRISECADVLRRRGRKPNRMEPATGWRRNAAGEFVKDELRQRQIAWIVEARGKGASWHWISDQLEPDKPRVAFRDKDKRYWTASRCRQAYANAMVGGPT